MKLTYEQFIENVYEIAFGDNAINRDFEREEVLDKIKEYSDLSLNLLTACENLLRAIDENNEDGFVCVQYIADEMEDMTNAIKGVRT
jgi:hypothetical protein